MNRPGITFILFFSLLSLAYAQTDQQLSENKRRDLGLSLQYYPAGVITTINAEFFYSPKASMVYRIGGNFTDRQDFSEYNDEETGLGFGGSAGYHKHFVLGQGEIIAGLNTDIWNMWIYWTNDIGEVNETEGQTYILVLQPWIESGYVYQPRNPRWHIGITAGFGREINVITDGKAVEQGWMLSFLLKAHYSIRPKNK